MAVTTKVISSVYLLYLISVLRGDDVTAETKLKAAPEALPLYLSGFIRFLL